MRPYIMPLSKTCLWSCVAEKKNRKTKRLGSQWSLPSISDNIS